MARKLLIPLSAALAGALISASPALAGTTDCDGLQSALTAATDGTTITLVDDSPCTGSYSLPSGTDLVLEGGAGAATLAGDGESQLLDGFNVGDVTIRGLRFQGGRTSGDGAAIRIVGYQDSVTIADNVFDDNDSGATGGAVYVGSQQLSLSEAREAQGGEVPSGGVTIADNVFGDGDGNRSDENGGALALYLFDSVELTGNLFQGNETHGRGGGASIFFCGTATVADNTFEDNTVLGEFGSEGRVAESEPNGGYAAGGGLWIGNNYCYFQGPVLDRGAQEAPPTESLLEQSRNDFFGNSLTTGQGGRGEGAGEYATGVTLQSTDDVFHGNAIGDATNGSGGGLYIDTLSDTALRNFVATANTLEGGGDGGAVRYGGNYASTLSLVHGTIANNAIGEGLGSAIVGQPWQTLLVDNSIIHGNTGGPELSGFGQQTDERSAAGVTPTGGVEVDFSLVCTDDGKAYDGDGNLCADPKLADAANGNVHQTAASPTLERASADLMAGLAKDYEGDTRPLDYDKANGAQPDMGADEAPAPADKPTTTTTQPPAPAASGGVLGTQARSCTSRRSFRIKLRNHGQKVVKATVIVNGKRVKVLRGKRLTSRVDLRGLPKGRFSVRIKLKLANGKTISGVRRYYTCRPGRRSGPPPV